MTNIKGAVKFTVESDCISNAKFVPGEALNNAIPKAIRQIFDSYCGGEPAFLNGWMPTNFRVAQCWNGYSKLLVDIEFRDKGRIKCVYSGTYIRNGDKMVREARPFTTKYVYKDDSEKVASITLPTDVPHNQMDDLVQEFDDLEFLIKRCGAIGLTTNELIDALKYISNGEGLFNGVSSVRSTFLTVLAIRRDPHNALYGGAPRFDVLLKHQPSVDTNGANVPLLARYYYAFLTYVGRNDQSESGQ